MLSFDDLLIKSTEARMSILRLISITGKGHVGGSLSCADILVYLYYNLLRYKVDAPEDPDRDRFILSKGHASNALYAILADVGFFSEDEFDGFNCGGMLGEHADCSIPGIETTTGSLGNGLGIGAGMALSAKMDDKDFETVVVLGDAECYEGSVWESAMFASHHNLNNITAIVDRNRLCIHGLTEDINRLEPFVEKWRSFGWEVREINGHSFSEIHDAFIDFRSRDASRPVVIVANTVKGKGISFMENQPSWHHGSLDEKSIQQAHNQLLQDKSLEFGLDGTL